MLYYQTFGSREHQPLLLLHSGGMAGVEWQPQIPLWQERYYVIVPDLLGHGQSALPAGEKLSIDGLGRAVLAMLDELGIEKVNVCGSSMGGATALWLAVHHPERVKRAIIYRISYHKNPATYAQTRQMADPAYWQQFGLQSWLSKIHEPQGGAEAWKMVIQRVSESLDPETSAHDHELSALERLKMPVLLITGDRDPVAPLDDVLAMYRVIPHAELWVMPAASHITASNTWRAAAFAEEVRRFLSRPLPE
ncbi:MAG: alpha/beta fold hydrolase [Cardiobacteriaceae bacterium]|nr:alpha/beta fold hydrolase [Cardiobacteriaceae bacterium]